jgi:hypothetical protein
MVWLRVNDDGSVTYHEENAGSRASQRGLQPRDRVMTVYEARQDWAAYADDIAGAHAFICKLNCWPQRARAVL